MNGAPKHPTLTETLVGRLAARKELALACAARALELLSSHGVEVGLVGSLARGDFKLHSDVDFLVKRLPREEMRYRLDILVEPEMEGLPFQFIYLDEVKSELARELLLAEFLPGIPAHEKV